MSMKSPATSTFLRFAPVVATVVLVTALSLLPAACFRDIEANLPRIHGLDKIVHGLMYAALTAACLHAVPIERRARLSVALTLALTSAVYGAAMEVCQKVLTVSRHMDPYDALANTVGALMCALAAYAWSHTITSKRERLEHT